MKGMHNVYDKENTLYQVENYNGKYLQLYMKDGCYFVENNGSCKKFSDKADAENYYIELYEKDWF